VERPQHTTASFSGHRETRATAVVLHGSGPRGITACGNDARASQPAFRMPSLAAGMLKIICATVYRRHRDTTGYGAVGAARAAA